MTVKCCEDIDAKSTPSHRMTAWMWAELLDRRAVHCYRGQYRNSVSEFGLNLCNVLSFPALQG